MGCQALCCEVQTINTDKLNRTQESLQCMWFLSFLGPYSDSFDLTHFHRFPITASRQPAKRHLPLGHSLLLLPKRTFYCLGSHIFQLFSLKVFSFCLCLPFAHCVQASLSRFLINANRLTSSNAPSIPTTPPFSTYH